MSSTVPTDAPFSPLEKAAIFPLLEALNAEQRAWTANYLSQLAAAPVVAAGKPAVTVFFGTESGNSEELAAKAAKTLKKAGHKAKAVNLADIKPTDLKKYEHALFIVSTWGEGDPPESAVPFYEDLKSIPKLDGMSYSVCALGDTSYEQFCEAGKVLDRALATAGATAVVERVDCDVDFDEPFGEWLAKVETALGQSSGEVAALALAAPAVQVARESVFGRSNPFPAELSEKVLLNGAGSKKEVWHLEFSLEGSGFSYQPGDSLALVPENDPGLVEEIISVLGFDPNVEVEGPKGSRKLADTLLQDLDITTASKAIVTKLAGASTSISLTELIADTEALKDYLRDRQLIDVISEHPLKKIDAQGFIGCLRKLPPRLYSIASSLTACPDEVHLTVGAVRYDLHDRPRKGVASTYCADRLDSGQKALVYIQPNKNFKLPSDPATPIIMVGPGTGIAPFRAFIQERAEQDNAGDSWLFFGDQHYTYDFLYQLEWQDYLADGKLSRLDVAFSRDQPEKIYVQDRMRARSEELYKWLEQGAHFYVCGDASRMAGDVHQALVDIYQQHGGLSQEDAEAKLAQLKKEKRYQRDVY